jgi:hypothetical protein
VPPPALPDFNTSEQFELGADDPRRIRHGLYSQYMPESWKKLYDKALMDPNLHSLSQDVALLRTILSKFINGIGDRNPTDAEMGAVLKATEVIGRTVERMAGRKGTLTAKGVCKFVEAVVRVVMDEVGNKDPNAAIRVAERLSHMAPPTRGDHELISPVVEQTPDDEASKTGRL